MKTTKEAWLTAAEMFADYHSNGTVPNAMMLGYDYNTTIFGLCGAVSFMAALEHINKEQHEQMIKQIELYRYAHNLQAFFWPSVQEYAGERAALAKQFAMECDEQTKHT